MAINDFAGFVKDSNNNVRAALMSLEVELMCSLMVDLKKGNRPSYWRPGDAQASASSYVCWITYMMYRC